ncbi:MAG: hypothetical protein CVV52_04850 [Spirochaetae bacterium HGW-Spirochaetae-8]|nr:MAG: hypothetical protein CVV52_04850 [Spirochaetae bacterium HGW-Spirochaetae-8]
MGKRITIAIILFSISIVSLLGVEVVVPNEIPGYENLELVLIEEDPAHPVVKARLYFLFEQEEEPLYVEFAKIDKQWTAIIPHAYLKGEEFIYFTEIQTKDGAIVRNPDFGEKKARLIQDTTPPSLLLDSPKDGILEMGKEQLVVFRVDDESGISEFNLKYNDTSMAKAAVVDNLLTLMVTPEEGEIKEARVIVTMADPYGNTAEQVFEFTMKPKTTPFFSAKADVSASLGTEYKMTLGETANTVDLATFFADMEHAVDISYDATASTTLAAGPLALDLSLELADTISAFDLLDAYPNTLIADYQNIMNLWHPWNFANEFDYTGEVPRLFYNSNQMYARVSFFGPVLSYTLGDQRLSFQEETIKELEFRGTGVSFDVGFLELAVGKGLTDPGLYQTAWPQNFFGFKFGFAIPKIFWLQTNLSFISSLQGHYETIISQGSSAIGTLYDLGSVKPEENLVFGLSMGTDNKLFKLTASGGLTLYVDDASQMIDKDQLATDVNTALGIDISPYLGYLNTISAYFPVLDYFPLSTGLAVKAVNKELWGITYGLSLDIPDFGANAWFRKTDGAYKSLGSAVTSDVMDLGASWEASFGDFGLFVGYDLKKDNIPDILINELLPIVKPGLITPSIPTPDSISQLVHTAGLALDTPIFNWIGSFTFEYTFEWETTNAANLAAKVTDVNDSAAILNDASNDTTLIHTADLRWKSQRYKLGDFSISLGAKTQDAFITSLLEDGVATNTSHWDFSYGVTTSMQLARFKLSLNFDQEWSTEAGSEKEYAYAGKFSISDIFFDSVALDGGFTQVYINTTYQAYKIKGGLEFSKNIGPLATGIALKGEYFDSLVDNTDDALTGQITVNGKLSF